MSLPDSTFGTTNSCRGGDTGRVGHKCTEVTRGTTASTPVLAAAASSQGADPEMPGRHQMQCVTGVGGCQLLVLHWLSDPVILRLLQPLLLLLLLLLLPALSGSVAGNSSAETYLYS
jgi:hypothetical protein